MDAFTVTLGQLWPKADKFFERAKGRINRIVLRSERWEGGIDFCVRVADPDSSGGREEDEDTLEVWNASVTFKRNEECPSPLTVATAREQERIAAEIWSRYGLTAIP